MSKFYASHPTALALLKKCKETLKDARADDSDVIQDIDRYLVWKDPKEELPEIPEGAGWVDVWVITSSDTKGRLTFFIDESNTNILETLSKCKSWVYALGDDNEPELP